MSLFIRTTLTTVIVSSSFAHKNGVFLQNPQNHTIFNLKQPFTLYCSIDIASEDGMDWVVKIKGIRERVCLSKLFYINFSNSCLFNYSMEVPNNRTLNLIVDPRIATLGDEYCCQFDNGFGKKSCSYLTISDVAVTDDPAGDLTVDAKFADATTASHYENITESEKSPGNSVVLIVVGVIGGIVIGGVFVVITVFVICFFVRKSRSKDAMKKKAASGNAEPDEESPFKQPEN